MLQFLLRSAGLGLATAVLLLLAVPSLRSNIFPPSTSDDTEISSRDQISFNHAVRNAAPAVHCSENPPL